MPPGGDSTSISLNFSQVQALISMKVTRISHGLAMHDVVQFQHYPDKIARYIRDFVDTVRSNENEIKNILQPEPMKLKPSPHHAATPHPSGWPTSWWAGGRMYR